jgi:hypothetical protein
MSLLEEARCFHSLDVSEAFKVASMSHAPYEEVFRTGLQERDYNFLLSDYSFLQFTHMGQRDGGVRYLFCPNPYEFISLAAFVEKFVDAIPEEDDPTELYSQFLSEQPTRFSAPAVRFEVDLESYREAAHPSAHFHFGAHASNRWPAATEFTPLVFGLNIAKMFYNDAWELFGYDPETNANQFDQALAQAKRNCENLGAEHFSNFEKQLPHFV